MDITIPKWLTDIFKGKEKHIIVKKGKMGLECFADLNKIIDMDKPNQQQLIAFINSIKEAIEPTEVKQCQK